MEQSYAFPIGDSPGESSCSLILMVWRCRFDSGFRWFCATFEVIECIKCTKGMEIRQIFVKNHLISCFIHYLLSM